MHEALKLPQCQTQVSHLLFMGFYYLKYRLSSIVNLMPELMLNIFFSLIQLRMRLFKKKKE